MKRIVLIGSVVVAAWATISIIISSIAITLAEAMEEKP
jgi:hypothetical protein